jgi:ribosomal-protein-alanine N-acetyltransferase
VIETQVRPSIRDMKVDDIPIVVDIDRMSFPVPWPERSYQFELTKNPSANLLVAEIKTDHGDKIIGYIGYWLMADEVHISTIAVHPTYRSKGIGAQLLESALMQAREKGASLATLEVRESNQHAMALYWNYGFQSSGVRTGYYHDNGENAVIMALEGLENFEPRVHGGGG